jgi:hypothetical protein
MIYSSNDVTVAVRMQPLKLALTGDVLLGGRDKTIDIEIDSGKKPILQKVSRDNKTRCYKRKQLPYFHPERKLIANDRLDC